MAFPEAVKNAKKKMKKGKKPSKPMGKADDDKKKKC